MGTPLDPRRIAVAALLWIGVSFAITLPNIQRPEGMANWTYDARRYIAMVQQQDVEPPYAYRVLVPSVARIIPDSAIMQLASRTQAGDDWTAATKLSLVGMVFLSLTGAATFVFLRALEFGEPWALAGSLLFYAMPTVLLVGGLPLVDAPSWFFLALGCALVLESRMAALAICFALGMLVKETLLLLAILIPLAPMARGTRARLLAALLPGLAVSIGLRLALGNGSASEHFAWGLWRDPAEVLAQDFARLLSPAAFKEVVFSFGVFWLLAAYGIRRIPAAHVLRRWAWLPVIAALGIVWLESDIGRLLFMAFPVVLPLALVGLAAALGLAVGDGYPLSPRR